MMARYRYSFAHCSTINGSSSGLLTYSECLNNDGWLRQLKGHRPGARLA